MSHVDVTETTFETAVLKRSFDVPVVVDFWADWCAPCRALGPVLEKLAGEADGEWELAKLDVDSNPYLAQTFGIQGIPAVKAFVDGRVAAEFVGALAEPQVREWLTQLGPAPADVAYDEGQAAELRGDLLAAADSYRRALDVDAGHPDARAALARIELGQRAQEVDKPALRARLETDPRDVEAAIGLSDALASEGDMESSFAVVLDAIRMTEGAERDRARVHLLSLLDTIPADDPRARAARRDLTLVLF